MCGAENGTRRRTIIVMKQNLALRKQEEHFPMFFDVKFLIADAILSFTLKKKIST